MRLQTPFWGLSRLLLEFERISVPITVLRLLIVKIVCTGEATFSISLSHKAPELCHWMGNPSLSVQLPGSVNVYCIPKFCISA